MCVGKGMLIIRGEQSPYFAMDSNDHAPLVTAKELRDDKPVEIRNFVRVEILPLDSLTSTNPDDWKVRWDEPSLPSWFEEDAPLWNEKCLQDMVTVIVPKWIEEGIGGYLDLRGTAVKTLGNLEKVNGSLYLRGTAVKTLGNLKECGYLDLQGTAVKTLGNLKECGSLYLQGTQAVDTGKTKIGRIIRF